MTALRPYRPEDLDTLHAIDIACFEQPFQFSRAALRRFIQTFHAHTVVAEKDSGTVGFVTVHLRLGARPHGYVVTLDVLGQYQRSGIGSQLLREGERLASAAGAVSMRLHVHTGNTAARSFYTRLGYRQVKVETGFYGGSLDAFLLEKPL